MNGEQRSDRHVIHELLVHAAAFFVAAAVLRHLYWFFERNTESPADARDAFLASIAIIGGIGPAITSLVLWIHRLIRRAPH